MMDLKNDYDAAIKRLYGQHDVMAEAVEVPSPVRDRVPTPSIAVRIADLATQVAEAAHALEDARERHREASVHRSNCEAVFAKVSAELLRAMNAHREGPPENVPERP